MDHLFSTYSALLRTMSDDEITSELATPRRLLIETAANDRRVDIAYAPFDHVNLSAKVVIVGITPGRQQARNALMKARQALLSGASGEQAMRAAKVFASFSGPMRSNLVAMLDHVGINAHLQLTSTASLWAECAHRVHFTSALRYPVFVDGKNYGGSPSMISTAILRRHLLKWFGDEMNTLRDAMFVPLGSKVAEGVEFVAKEIGFDQNRILSGLPHPSGANGERIAFFLGRKERTALSRQVKPDDLLAARAAISAKLARLT